jgi:hypothetical protein
LAYALFVCVEKYTETFVLNCEILLLNIKEHLCYNNQNRTLVSDALAAIAP